MGGAYVKARGPEASRDDQLQEVTGSREGQEIGCGEAHIAKEWMAHGLGLWKGTPGQRGCTLGRPVWILTLVLFFDRHIFNL